MRVMGLIKVTVYIGCRGTCESSGISLVRVIAVFEGGVAKDLYKVVTGK